MPGLKVNARIFIPLILVTVIARPGWSQQSAAPAQTQNGAALPPAPQSSATQPSSQFSTPDYAKSVRPFPDVLAPYKPRAIAETNLANTPRMDQLMRDGKIYLSMDDAVALALENNLDLELARYNLNIADTDILRAQAGSNILGVNTGIIQNTPGGGVGGLSGAVGSGTGGTSIAAGGAGTGTNGLVSSQF
jgi:outer membrane protein